MDYQEFRAAAIESSELYYQFLAKQEKGYSSVGVRSVSGPDPDGLLHLHLSNGLEFTSDLQIKAKDMIFDNSEVEVSHYDGKSHTLTIRPQKQFLHLFADPKDIFVISDLKFLVQRVRNWYLNRSTPLTLPDTIPDLKPCADHFSAPLSKEQLAALRGIFNSPLSYVWGAPGTGKTQFVLARAALAYCLEGKPILITAPTNNAVEQTLRGVLPVLEEAGLPLTKVLRLGTPSSEFYQKYPMVCEVRAVEAELEEIENRLVFLHRAQAYHDAQAWLELADEIVSCQSQALDKINAQAAELLSVIHSLEFSRNQLQDKFSPVFAQINQLTTRKSQLTYLLEKKRSNLSAWLNKRTLGEAALELADVEKNLSSCNIRHSELVRKSEALNARIEQAKSNLANILRKRSDILAALRAIPPSPFPSAFSKHISSFSSSDDCEKALSDASRLLSQLRGKIGAKSVQYAHLPFQNVLTEIETLSQRKAQLDDRSSAARLPECLVVAATVDGCISKLQKSDCFHPCHVFLDEAAYCPLIKGVTLLSFETPITLLGDHMQIPPVCEADDHHFLNADFMPVFLWAQSALYIEDIFYKNLNQLSADYQNRHTPLFNRLQKYDLLHTFRFGENLAQVLAQFVYTMSFHGNEKIDTKIVVLHAPLRSLPSKKNTSPAEADAILRYLSQHGCEHYAVLTPYRNQRALLARNSPHILPPENVFTIHGSQGREWDTVFLSVVSSRPTQFLSPRLINTAVSRAKKTLIIVCDCESWSVHSDHMIGALVSAARWGCPPAPAPD